jgi:hypothetical protein
MFGIRKGRQKSANGSPAVDKPVSRDRLWSALLNVLGPASVDGAIQGHSPEARQAWKDLQESRKRVRDEARRKHEEERKSQAW